MPPPNATRRTRTRAPWWLWTIGALLLVVATIALLGGFNAVPQTKLPRFALGETYEGPELHVSVESVTLSALSPVTQNPADEDEQYLIVTAVVENVTRSISYGADDSIRVQIDGVISADDAPDRFVELRNGDGVGALQPRLPVRIAYVWTVGLDDVAVGDEVVVGLIERLRVSGDPVFGDTSYGPRTVIGRVDTVATAGKVPSDD